MADPLTTPIVLFYTNDSARLIELGAALLKDGRWFDARVIEHGKQWSIAFNSEGFKMPAKLSKAFVLVNTAPRSEPNQPLRKLQGKSK